MSCTPPPDTEVEEGSPVGEAICEDSSPENTMQSSAATEIEENTEQTDENLFPFNSVSVELYEGPEESEDSSQTKISEYEAGVEESNNETQDMQGVVNTVCSSPSNSRDSRTVDAIFSDASKSNLDEPDACEPAAVEPVAEDSSDAYDPNIVIKDEVMDTEELQKTYIEDFLYSNTSTSFDEASNSANDEKGCPLSRFSKIVRAVEQADYETLQMLYQLLYQRSAWDTQEILTQRILEFSGFNFSQSSEDYFNREMMLRTQPNEVLRKIGAILCLEMRKFSDTGKERHDLIASIMEFLSKPKRKSRAPRGGTDVKKDEEREILLAADKCGCRNRCLKKFTEAQKKNILKYLDLLEREKMLDAYIISLFHSKKIERKPGAAEESKKLKEVLYQYKVKYGKKEVPVCKGAFCILHGIKLGKVNQLQIKVKSGGMAPLNPKDYPPFITDGTDDKDVDVNENEVKDQQKSPNQQKSPHQQKSASKNRSKKKSTAGPKSSKREARKSIEDYKTEEELKESITSQKVIPKVVIEKVDLKAVTSIKISEIDDTEVSGVKIGINSEVKVDADVKENQKSDGEKKESQKSDGEKKESQKSDGEKKESQKSDGEKKENKKPEKLKDFPLVVRSIENAPEELLIDIHFLLYLNSASADKVKENILEFSGFPFDADTEEFDERNEFLQRMSNKIITDVARSFSLGLLSTKEDTIKNILSFLSKPDESYLRAVAVPVILSDVELDDIGDMSDSDESITCEVVEKKVECIDLISSGDESDKEDKAGKEKQTKKPPPPKKTTVPQSTSAPQATTNTSFQTSTFSPVIMPGSAVSNSTPSAPVNTTEPVSTAASVSNSEAASGQKRTLRNFETICKIVNTHPHEYLVDIYDLLYLKKHEPSTLRNDILDFSGFTFEKGSTEYIKRKQLLDRMLYNSVRRIYNTLIHTTTEVKVYSKPTMIAEIFQFLFKLPDHDTSVRPPPTTKPAIKPALAKGCPVVKVVPGMAGATVPPAPLPSQSGKLSDLKR
ncbi:Protein DEK, partial [Stegodyphus mimosarum]